MKTRGIPMTAANAEACALGTKTETRRLIKWPKWAHREYGVELDRSGAPQCFNEWDGEWLPVPVLLQPGDFIYIKEPYRLWSGLDSFRPSQIVAQTKGGAPAPVIKYECDAKITGPLMNGGWGRYRHARFMPKEFARSWGRVVEVKAERVQEITEEGAIREGMDWNGKREPGFPGWRVPGRGGGRTYHNTPTEAYAEVWDEIHGPGSWERNDWVWVIRWGKCERPEDI